MNPNILLILPFFDLEQQPKYIEKNANVNWIILIFITISISNGQ